ncbi:SRP54L [Auxenochlorella protothecoides x Auxenochlorella symbiontica]
MRPVNMCTRPARMTTVGAVKVASCSRLRQAFPAFQLSRPRSNSSGPLYHRRSQLVTRAAMFDTLSQSLNKAWGMVQKDARLTPENMKAPLREIRRALLEADVPLMVVRPFIARVEGRALGAAVTKGVSPQQQLVKIVYDELVILMGGKQVSLNVPEGGDPQVILMAGLQGTGKTTTAAKLAAFLKNKGGRVMLVATDVYRPAAIEQLVVLGGQVGVPVFERGLNVPPADIAREGVALAKEEGMDTVIIDTAGRLQIDATLMQELQEISSAVRPTDTLLVVDAMTGQEAAGLVKTFNTTVPLTGAIVTKLDGDARGGAALAVKEVSGCPIKFVGMGEKTDALELFYPDRMASRILGMGDVLTLVEKAESMVKEEEAAALTKKMLTAKFDLNDFLKQYKMISGMGNLTSVLKMLPGMSGVSDKQLQAVEAQYKVYESMIQSMTRQERANPDLLAKMPSRRRRVARGSGREEAQVAELIAVYTSMRAQMQTMTRMMALSGGASGLGGMPSMSDEEMMAAALGSAGPRQVPPGKVRRKKRRDIAPRQEAEAVASV